MMTDVDTIGFPCPHCQTALTVPASASGAKGPCPHCGSVIQAPTFRMIKIPLVVEASQTYPAAPPRERILAAPVEDHLELPAPALDLENDASSEARQLPALTTQPSPTIAREKEQREILKIAAVLIGLATLVIGTVIGASLYKNRSEKPDLVLNPPVSPQPPPAIPELLAEPIADPLPPIPEEKPVVKIPEPPVPRGTDVPAMVRSASVVLGEFLEARNLDVRMLMIETKTALIDLESSVLAKPLPLVKSTEPLGVTFDKTADTADLLFRVDFELIPGEIEQQLVLLRKRGNLEAKVVVDPFLDGYGGRLEKFLSAPTFGTQEFQSLITVNDFTQPNAEIPDPSGKSTVRIAITQRGRVIASAYFPKSSALSDKIVLMGLKPDHEVPATYALRWNTSEDSAKPYVELIDVTALKWESR